MMKLHVITVKKAYVNMLKKIMPAKVTVSLKKIVMANVAVML